MATVNKIAHYLSLIFIGTALAGTGNAATIIGGVEDIAGVTAGEGIGDFNDMIFRLSGDITWVAPGASLTSLTPGVVGTPGSVYWNNGSYDGAGANIGYCVLGNGNCPYGMLSPDPMYLAGPGGSAPTNITFTATGLVTLDLLGGITARTNSTLGWYDPNSPAVLHELIGPGAAYGSSVTFLPTSTFALYFYNGTGETFGSVAGNNINDSFTQQHFAFFTTDPGNPPGPPPAVPESGTVIIVGLGLLCLGIHGWRTKAVRPSRPFPVAALSS